MQHSSLPSVAFLGTGLMGEPMALRLLSAGYAVTVWNRTIEKTTSLKVRGAKIAASPQDAARDAHFLISMLANGHAVTEGVFESEALRSLAPNSLWIDMSSIPPALAREHAHNAAKCSVQHLDSPVSGGTKGAASGNLAIMVGGPSQAFDRARPVLEVLGRPVLVGPSGSGQIAKLANQAIVGISIGAVAEALLFAAAGGADPDKVKEALMGGFADSEILRQHGQRMIERSFVPGGPTWAQVKDLNTLAACAAELHLTLPLVDKAAELFESCLATGLGKYDHSALLLELERRNPGTRLGKKADQIPE